MVLHPHCCLCVLQEMANSVYLVMEVSSTNPDSLAKWVRGAYPARDHGVLGSGGDSPATDASALVLHSTVTVGTWPTTCTVSDCDGVSGLSCVPA